MHGFCLVSSRIIFRVEAMLRTRDGNRQEGAPSSSPARTNRHGTRRARVRRSGQLERFRLEKFVKGWFVGDFQPTLIPSDAVEVGIKHYRAGDYEASHHHKVATELTVVVSGRVRMSGQEFGAGDILKIAPGGSTDFMALTDAITVVVKMPCVAGDKYLDS
jgi:hypothetical protein